MWTDLDSKLSEQAFEKDLRDQTVSLAQELATGIGVQQIIGVPEVLQQEIEAFNRLRRDLSGLEVFLASPHRPVLAASTPGSSLAIPMPEAWDRTLEGHVLTSLERSQGTRIWKVTAPITVQGSIVGAIQVRSSLESTDRLAARERRQSLSIMTAASVPAEPALKPIDTKPLVQALLNLLAPVFSRRQVTASTAFASDLPAITGDATQLQQVLLNCLMNAFDAMPNGGILHIATERGLPRCQSAIVDHRPQRAVGDYIVMNITATGVGIAAADLQRIFEPFFTTKAHGGHIEQDWGLPMAPSSCRFSQVRCRRRSARSVGTGRAVLIALALA